jgi:hypothetical protein
LFVTSRNFGSKETFFLYLLPLLLAVLFLTPARAQQEAQELSLLLVDETRTVEGSLLVNMIGAALNRSGIFSVRAECAAVESPLQDPLGINVGDERFDLVLIVPPEPSLARTGRFWMVTCSPGFAAGPQVQAGEQAIAQILEQAGRRADRSLEAVNVRDAGLAGFFGPLLQQHGWLNCLRGSD